MQMTTATAISNDVGPLRRVVVAFNEAQAKVLASGVKWPADWVPMSEFVAVGEFRRVGAYLEEFNYMQYCDFMTK